ncbi:membrane protein [Streptomyces griseoflavus]|uniref:ABC transporter permease n=1 Tax=Streptomyces rimosus TaxID=1927 RepID=UPI0004CA6E93|nr:ABC transporter permease [Streptomyces rimosus]KOG53063.1 membrane protein [Streptomyces griseoflavus]
MSATGIETRPGAAARTGTRDRLTALARAELTLLGRNKTTLFMALLMPLIMAFALHRAVAEMPLEKSGLSVGTALLPGTIGFVLIFAVYGTVTGALVTRREELVLKRLRCGELTDREILAGTALPTVLIGLAQCVLLVICGGLALKVDLPRAPHLLLLGVLLGMVIVVAMAAASTAITKSAEAASLTTLPFVFVSMACSGMVAPLEIFPDRVAAILELLPLSPVMGLVRDGWLGEGDLIDTLKRLVIALAWAGIAVFAVRRWFRWEPRH